MTDDAALDDDARLMAVHARWAARQLNRDSTDLDYQDDWYWEQCGECWHWLALGGQLGNDWGVCANGEAPFDATIRFEHDSCRMFVPAPNGFGAQRG